MFCQVSTLLVGTNIRIVYHIDVLSLITLQDPHCFKVEKY